MSRLARLLDANLLILLVVVYVLAAFLPALGTLIRTQVVFDRPFPVLLLSVMLFLAGIGIEPREVHKATKSWFHVLAGCVLMVVAPGLIVLLLGGLPISYPVGMLAGLGLVALMPTAASSVAWTQLSRGNVTINIAMLLMSTLLTPFVLGMFWQHDTTGLAESKIPVVILGMWIVPALLLGVLVRYFLGTARVQGLRPMLKSGNASILLLLNYANASAALPEIVRDFRPLQVMAIVATTLAMCAVVFTLGSVATRLVEKDRAKSRSLVYGMGLKNTGMALVVAGLWAETLPLAMVAIIVYTFSQHLLAAMYHQWNLRIDSAEETADGAN
ncbi:bile acid:sodium symporter [Bremerella sp. JC770]|uniref:bile acid:sodium symporter family protein n=1 Tax=Bremerella sp. JC770 TaxID=3232137 RepID=UPI0034588B59